MFLSPLQAHRKHAEYLNKKIDMYDELAIVVEKDTATGGFSKSYVDLEHEPDNGDSAEFVADNVEEGVVEKGKNAVESSTIGSGISKSCKRGRAASNADESVLTDLSDQLKEIVVGGIYRVFCIVRRIQLSKLCICTIQIPYVGIIFVHHGGGMANT